jgi:truncated hemoglobin YjbI
MGERPLGPNQGKDEMAALCFIIKEQKAQLDSKKRVLEWHRKDVDASSHRRANLLLYYLSGATQRSQSRYSPRSNRHHLARNLEEEFNEAGILPKTRDAAIMATSAYIAAHTPNDDEHMPKL